MIQARLPILMAAFLITACVPQNDKSVDANASDGSKGLASAGSMPNGSDAEPSPIISPQDAPTLDRTNQTGVSVLKDVLTRVGQIDGRAITNFALTGRCASTFTTAAGKIPVNWAAVGTWAAHDQDGRTIIDIDDGGGTHAVSVPSTKQSEPVGDAAARLDGGFGMIADTCSRQQ